jgi:uncharacterized protein YecT (DUF1311 family)
MTSNLGRSAVRLIGFFAGALMCGGAVADGDGRYPNVAASPADIPAKSAWYQQCLRVQSLAPPQKDIAASIATKDCGATDLYYDTLNSRVQVAHGWDIVRQCAFATHDYGVLTMLYANGMGVSRDLDLATRYACSTESSIAEMEGRIANLMDRARGGATKEFDLCDDITSGYMEGICAQIYERKNAKSRESRLAAAVSNWSIDQKAALRNLRAAVNEFARLRADDETDLSGTARRALQVEAQASELDQFTQDIVDFEEGKQPKQSSTTSSSLDLQLNQTYHTIMRASRTDLLNMGTVTKAGVRNAERAWLSYRDAWLKLASLKYPQLDRQGLKAMLTDRRLKQLLGLLGRASPPISAVGRLAPIAAVP